MRVLILGGTRFIGFAAARRLLEAGHDVAVFHRGEHEPPGLEGALHIHGDRSRIAEHAAEFARAAPDAVLDTGAMSEADAAAALGALPRSARRAVCVSSVDVYRAYGRLHGSEPGPVEPMPITEDAPLRERLFPYRREQGGRLDGYDKIPAERAYLDHPDIDATIVRLPAVHGEGDYQHRLFIDLARFDAGRPFVLCAAEAAAWRWPRAYAGNVAVAIALAVTDSSAAGRVYNAPCDPPLPLAEFQRTIGRIAGWSGEIRMAPAADLPEHLAPRVNYTQDMEIDGSRMRRELGYEDRFSAEEGLRRAIAWERAHPPSRIEPAWVDFSIDDAGGSSAC